jgi:hypothetical protein
LKGAITKYLSDVRAKGMNRMVHTKGGISMNPFNPLTVLPPDAKITRTLAVIEIGRRLVGEVVVPLPTEEIERSETHRVERS